MILYTTHSSSFHGEFLIFALSSCCLSRCIDRMYSSTQLFRRGGWKGHADFRGGCFHFFVVGLFWASILDSVVSVAPHSTTLVYVLCFAHSLESPFQKPKPPDVSGVSFSAYSRKQKGRELKVFPRRLSAKFLSVCTSLFSAFGVGFSMLRSLIHSRLTGLSPYVFTLGLFPHNTAPMHILRTESKALHKTAGAEAPNINK